MVYNRKQKQFNFGGGISDYLREDMQKVIDTQKKLNNEDLIIEIYAPGFAYNGIQPLADEPLGVRYYNYYYGGHIYRMKDYSVKYFNLSSGLIEKNGTITLNHAKAFTNFVVSAAGAVSKTVTAFGIFSSAYDLYKTYCGEVVTGISSDRIYTNLIYNRIIKETYAPDPVYGDYPNAGCISHKAWLDRHDTYQYYGATGNSYLSKPSLNTEHFSENFEDPAPEAILNGISSTYIDGFLSTTIFNTTVRLMGF